MTQFNEQQQQLFDMGLRLLDAGISIIPVDTHKKPLTKVLPQILDTETGKERPSWKPYRERFASRSELEHWITEGAQLAIVCGAVSGGVLIIDVDEPHFLNKLKDEVGDLIDQLPLQQTGGGGYQLICRCENPGQNERFAWIPDQNMKNKNGRTIAIESRGEGGYALVYPSLHESGQYYTCLRGDFAVPPRLSQEDVQKITNGARAICEAPMTRSEMALAEKKTDTPQKKNGPKGDSALPNVIEEYNRQFSLEQTLSRYGYQKRTGDRYAVPGHRNPSVWVQPRNGIMMSFHHSSNDPFNDGRWHNAFDLFCYHEHHGDVKAAVKAAAKHLGMAYPHTLTSADLDGEEDHVTDEEKMLAEKHFLRLLAQFRMVAGPFIDAVQTPDDIRLQQAPLVTQLQALNWTDLDCQIGLWLFADLLTIKNQFQENPRDFLNDHFDPSIHHLSKQYQRLLPTYYHSSPTLIVWLELLKLGTKCIPCASPFQIAKHFIAQVDTWEQPQITAVLHELISFGLTSNQCEQWYRVLLRSVRGHLIYTEDKVLPENMLLTSFFLVHKDLFSLTHGVWDAILNDPFYGSRIFQMGTELVEVRDGQIKVIDEDRWCMLINQLILFRKPTRSGYVAESPPDRLYRLSYRHRPYELRRINQVVPFPIVLGDGRILDTPGYDDETKIFLDDLVNLPGEMPLPTALAWIEEMVQDFIFEDQSDMTNALAYLLTPFIRQQIECVPLWMIEAASPGTGKGLLNHIFHLVWQGESPALSPAPRDRSGSNDEEWRKAMTSYLIDQPLTITFDNVTLLDSDHLAKVLTDRVWQDRLLGGSKAVKIPVNSIFLATGNNVTINGDMPRRVVKTRLMSLTEDPSLRTDLRKSEEDLKEWVCEHRGSLIRACLTLCQYGIQHGPLWQGIKMGSFTGWCGLMGKILTGCGINGFLENIPRERPLLGQQKCTWQRFIEQWFFAHNISFVTASELIDLAEREGITLKGDDQKARKVSLSRQLKKERGKVYVVNNKHYRLECATDKWKHTTYQLSPVSSIKSSKFSGNSGIQGQPPPRTTSIPERTRSDTEASNLDSSGLPGSYDDFPQKHNAGGNGLVETLYNSTEERDEQNGNGRGTPQSNGSTEIHRPAGEAEFPGNPEKQGFCPIQSAPDSENGTRRGTLETRYPGENSVVLTTNGDGAQEAPCIVWRNRDHDEPVTPTYVMGLGSDGQEWYIGTEGASGGLPFSELFWSDGRKWEIPDDWQYPENSASQSAASTHLDQLAEWESWQCGTAQENET